MSDASNIGLEQIKAHEQTKRGLSGYGRTPCSVPHVSDDEILSLWRTVRPSPDQTKAMTYVKWKDGIDCDYPTHELRRLVELAMADGFKMAQNAGVDRQEKAE